MFFLRYLVLQNGLVSKSLPELVQQLTIKDAVYWIAEAWQELSPETLTNGWNKLLWRQDISPSKTPEKDMSDFSELFTSLGAEEGGNQQIIDD